MISSRCEQKLIHGVSCHLVQKLEKDATNWNMTHDTPWDAAVFFELLPRKLQRTLDFGQLPEREVNERTILCEESFFQIQRQFDHTNRNSSQLILLYATMVLDAIRDVAASSSTVGTCDACGWMAAIGGMLAFGSFGAPIKSKTALSVDIDPLVMQSYKTGMCFITACLFLLIYGEPFTFTPWGIVSGLFWVPGGVATIFAIKTAGLAIAIGVGSSFIVLVSFTWGIFIFQEHVHSKLSACGAVSCMMLGLLGMAYFSASSSKPPGSPTADASAGEGQPYQGLPNSNSLDEDDDGIVNNVTNDSEQGFHDEEREENDGPIGGDADNDEQHPQQPLYSVICGRWKVRRRTLGILAAALVTGVYGGSIMVPMQFAPANDKGLGYLMSFAIGASLVNLTMWILRYFYSVLTITEEDVAALVSRNRIPRVQIHVVDTATTDGNSTDNGHDATNGTNTTRHDIFTSTIDTTPPTLTFLNRFYYAFQSLPSFHLRKMWLPGGTAGLLWSIGNFCSILSVEYLGEGVGYSVTQASILGTQCPFFLTCCFR